MKTMRPESVTTQERVDRVTGRMARHPRFLAGSIILASLLWVGGIVGTVGGFLPPQRDQQLSLYCGGKCVCDGGVVDMALLRQVCPEDSRARRRRLKERRRAIREQVRKLQRSEPPPDALIPSV